MSVPQLWEKHFRDLRSTIHKILCALYNSLVNKVMSKINTLPGKVSKTTNNLFQGRDVGWHTRGTIFVKRILDRSRPLELDTHFHEHRNNTFPRFARLPRMSLIISDHVVQGLVSIFDSTYYEKLVYAIESIWGFDTDFAPIPATVAKTKRQGMESRHGVWKTRCDFVLDKKSSAKIVYRQWEEALKRYRHVKRTKTNGRERDWKERANGWIDVCEPQRPSDKLRSSAKTEFVLR